MIIDRQMKQYADEINEASRLGKLVFFVGAGVSRLSEYPTWGGLVDKFYKELYGKDRVGEYSSDELLRIPQFFYESKGKRHYELILRDVFDVEKEPHDIHYKILSLNPAHIITTNYDDLLEQTCRKRAKHYTKISADEELSRAASSRFLIKAHGDFSRGFRAENVVLKEDDYRHYDQNYALISTWMKTSLATSTLVFIGYSFRDHNIKLLLDWAIQFGKKHFIIRTDYEPIKDFERKYYENRGLMIIDSASMVDSERLDFTRRYGAVMDVLIGSRDNTREMDDSEVIEFIYHKIKPLFVLKSIRKIDLSCVFDNDYCFMINGLIVNIGTAKPNYIEKFYHILTNSSAEVADHIQEKRNAIFKFFSENKILGMLEDAWSKSIIISYKIDNPVFDANYAEIEGLIGFENDDVESIYEKAFYLAIIGEWEESYELYTKIIVRTIASEEDSEKLRICFLALVNRYHLYLFIKRYYGTHPLVIGRANLSLSQDFLEQIENELKYFDLDDLFSSMPHVFQEDYKILKPISDSKFLYDDTVKLFELISKVRDGISKGAVTIGGLSDGDKILLEVYETVQFLYNNHLLSVFSSQFKRYVRDAITLQFENVQYYLTRPRDELTPFHENNPPIFQINCFVFILIAKTFNTRDIEHIERVCNISRLPFKEKDKIEEYLLRLVDKFETCYSDDKQLINERLYIWLIDEVKSAICFAKYVSLSPKCITKLINAILFLIPGNELSISKKYERCNRLAQNKDQKKCLPLEAIELIDGFLLRYYVERAPIDDDIYNFASLIKVCYPEYVSKSISEYVMTLNDPTKGEVDCLYKLSKILSLESRQYLFSKKSITTIRDLIYCLDAGDIKSLEEYDELILDHVRDCISKRKREKEEGITIMAREDYLVEIAKWYFMGKLMIDKLKEYKGVVDEYDMFIEPDTFDYTKFEPEWLKRYSDELLTKISENDYMRNKILEVLKEKLLGSKDNECLNIVLRYFARPCQPISS